MESNKFEKTSVCLDCNLFKKYIKETKQIVKFKKWKAKKKSDFLEQCMDLLNGGRK